MSNFYAMRSLEISSMLHFELCGFKVMALVCDCLAANRHFFQLHKPDAMPVMFTK